MKKLVALLVALMVLTLSFAAVAEAEKLVVYTSADFPPFEYIDDNNAFAGFDIDMMSEIAKVAGYEVEFVNIAFDSIIAGVQSGACNVGLSGFTVNEERKVNVDFSTPYYQTTQACFALEGSTITDAASLMGKSIGVQMGTTGMFTAEGVTDADKVMSYTKIIDAFMDLKGGKLDAVIIDQMVGRNNVTAMPQAGITELAIAFEAEDYAICVQKGQTALLEKLDAAIEELKTNGTMQELLVKHQLIAAE
ncbi:MAG: basic amino acid ABC transporter substrate-binding protein [Clostridia bacterium]